MTPGKWKVFSWPTNNPDDGKVWCYGFRIKRNQDSFAEHEANARAMEQVPALIETLEAARTQFWQLSQLEYYEKRRGSYRRMLEKIDRVLAKAKGKGVGDSPLKTSD